MTDEHTRRFLDHLTGQQRRSAPLPDLTDSEQAERRRALVEGGRAPREGNGNGSPELSAAEQERRRFASALFCLEFRDERYMDL